MLKSKKVWAWTAASVIVVALAWAGWLVWQVNKDLNRAVSASQRIQDAVVARDTTALDSQLSTLREASTSAAKRTSGLTWSVLTKVPIFGDDAAGIETTSRVLADLADDGVGPLMSASDRFEELLPKGGAIDLSVVQQLQAPVAQADQAFAVAGAELAGVDDSGFVGRLNAKFKEFRDQVDRASEALDSAAIATQVLPTMLGADGPRHYLLAFENNAELRGMGGMVGAASYVEAENGHLDLTEHVTGGSLGEADKPALPLTHAETELYGDVFGTYFVNATLTPDVPRAADLMRARWEQQHPQRPIDGVVFVDAVAISYLLEATQPVVVDGVKVTGANAVDELLHNTYLRLEPAEQDQFFADVAAETFKRFTTGLSNPTGALEGLGRAVSERRIAVHSFDEATQQQWAGTSIAGEFTTADPNEPDIAVTVSDMTGSKMSYYLSYDVDVAATTCRGSAQSYTAKARLHSSAPADAASLPSSITGGGRLGTDPGNQLLAVRIFGPDGGSVSGMELNGVASDVVSVDDDGRPVAMTYIQLTPGQTVDLAWKMTSGPGQTGDTHVTMTPTIERKDNTRVLTSTCAN